MKFNNMFKKVVISSLTLAMILGGSTAAFADGKGKGKKFDRERNEIEMEFAGNKGKFEIKLHFNDMTGGDVEWAMRYIASLAAKKVFEGYEDGTFQPRKPISRIEAITAAVRLLGLRDQAESQAEMSTKLNFKDAAKIEQKYPWAVGYVAVAAEHDLFSETDDAVQPDKAADRLWATTLLVKALKLENEAKAKMNTKLTFKDAGEIPAGSVGYVAVAVEKGLINGYENNTFRPYKPVTRAELAALLDRAGTQLPEYNNNISTGTVSAVNGNVLTIVNAGQTAQLALHPDTVILRGGVQVSASALKVGDEVKATVYNNMVTLLEVTKPVEQQNQNGTFEGAVSAAVSGNTLVLTNAGQASQFTLNANTVFVRNGAQVTAADLKVGDEVKVYVVSNTVTIVQVTKPVDQQNQDFTVDGKFYSLTLDSQGKMSTISVTQSVYNSTQLRVYNVAPDVTIIGNAALLVPNQDVQLKGSNNIVKSVEIK